MSIISGGVLSGRQRADVTANGGRRAGAAGPRVRPGPQLAIVAAAVAAYFLVRGATEAAYAEALRNAELIVGLERALGIYHEPALQAALVTGSAVRTVLNGVYIWGHWPVVIATLLLLARRHPAVYLRMRDAMLLSGGVGLVIFVTFPLAPPRLADLGMTDTVSVASHAYRVLQPAMFTNQYAAMPSLHVGWNLLAGLAIMAAARTLLVRVLAGVMPVAMVVAVVLTANHYLLDVVAGAALATAGWLAAAALARRRAARTTANPADVTVDRSAAVRLRSGARPPVSLGRQPTRMRRADVDRDHATRTDERVRVG